MASDSLAAWSQNYLKRLQSVRNQPSPQDSFTARVLAARAAPIRERVQTPEAKAAMAAAVSEWTSKGIGSGFNLGSTILDGLMRPLYTVGSVGAYGRKNWAGSGDAAVDAFTRSANSQLFGNTGNISYGEAYRQTKDEYDKVTATNPFQAAAQGLSGQNKVTPGDLVYQDLENSGANGVTKFAGSLMANIGLDPLSYVPINPIVRAFQKGARSRSGTTATSLVDDSRAARRARGEENVPNQPLDLEVGEGARLGNVGRESTENATPALAPTTATRYTRQGRYFRDNETGNILSRKQVAKNEIRLAREADEAAKAARLAEEAAPVVTPTATPVDDILRGGWDDGVQPAATIPFDAPTKPQYILPDGSPIEDILQLGPGPQRAALEGRPQRLQLESGTNTTPGGIFAGTPEGGVNAPSWTNTDVNRTIAQAQMDEIDSAIRQTQIRENLMPVDDVYNMQANIDAGGRRTQKGGREWVARNRHRLSEKDFKWLQRSKSQEQFTQRLNEIQQRGIAPATPLESLDDALLLRSEGRMTEESFQRFVQIAGTDKPAEIARILKQRIAEAAPHLNPTSKRINIPVEVVERASTARAVADAQKASFAVPDEVIQASRGEVPDAPTQQILEDIGAVPSAPEILLPKDGFGTVRNNEHIEKELTRITRRVADNLKASVNGDQRALRAIDTETQITFKADQAMALLKSTRDTMESRGVYGSISSGVPESQWDLDFHDIFTAAPEIQRLQFRTGQHSNIYPKQISTGAAKAMDMSITSGLTHAEKVAEVAKTMRGATPFNPRMRVLNDTIEQVAESLVRATPKLHDLAIVNAGRRSVVDAQRIRQVHDEIMDSIVRVFDDPNVLGATRTKYIAGLSTEIRHAAEAAGVTPQGLGIAVGRIMESAAKVIPEGFQQNALTAIRTARDIMKGVPRSEINARIANYTDDFADEAETMAMAAKAEDDAADAVNAADGAPVGNNADEFYDMDYVRSARIEGRMHSLNAGTSALLGINTKGLREVFRGNETYAMIASERFDTVLGGVTRKFSRKEVNEAFGNVLRGTPPEGATAAQTKLHEDLTKMLELTHDSSNPALKNGLFGGMFRNNALISEINRALAMKGVKGRYNPATKVRDEDLIVELQHKLEALRDAKTSKKGYDAVRNNADIKAVSKQLSDAKKGTAPTPEQVSQQWRGFKEDLDDPLEYMRRVFAAKQHVDSLMATGIEFSRLTGVSSKVRPGPDFFKVKGGESSTMAKYVDQDLWYPKNALDKLADLDSLMGKALNFRGEKGALAAIVNNVVDPVMRIFKPWVTIARPGHHMRNMMGDVFMNMLRGVYSPRYYAQAIAQLKLGTTAYKGDVQALQRFLAGERVDVGGKELFRTAPLRNGKSHSMGTDESYLIMSQQGMLPEYRIREDLYNDVDPTRKASKLTKWMTENRYMRGMGQVSEKTGHAARMAEWNHYMQNPKFMAQFDTIDEAAHQAAVLTRKHHPDSTGLAPIEQKVMRRIFPFYSWLRQAVPVVMATMLSNPARVTAVPKAMYSLALANGVNPDSLSDPFPTDKLFPSFIREGLTGPVLGDFTMNLGSPTEGVLGGGGTGLLNGNIARNIGGMASPFLKIPVEQATGKSIGTGVHIPDESEYWDSQTPGINQLSNLTGISPYGTVGNMLNGEETVSKSGDNYGVIDPQRSVQKGEKDMGYGMQTLNWLSGLGLQNTQKPTYNKVATEELLARLRGGG